MFVTQGRLPATADDDHQDEIGCGVSAGLVDGEVQQAEDGDGELLAEDERGSGPGTAGRPGLSLSVPVEGSSSLSGLRPAPQKIYV